MDYVEYINRHYGDSESDSDDTVESIVISRDISSDSNRQGLMARGLAMEMRVLQQDNSTGTSWASIDTPPEPRVLSLRDTAEPCFPHCMPLYDEFKNNLTQPIAYFFRVLFLMILSLGFIWLFFFYWVNPGVIGVPGVKNNGTDDLPNKNLPDDN